MKKSVFTDLAAATIVAVGSAAFAVPTATYVKSIDVSSVSNFPSSIDYYNNALFVGSFTNQDVIKIDDPLNVTPTVTQFADLTSDYTWAGGRGVGGLNIDQSNGDLYVAGDTGTVGALAIITQAGSKTIKTATERLTSVARFGPETTAVVASYVISSSMRTYDTTNANITQASVSSVFTAPVNANVRDVAVAGNKVYFARNGGAADGYAEVDTTTSTVPFTLTNQLPSRIAYLTTVTHTVGAMGIGYGEVGGVGYVLVPDLEVATVRFIEASTIPAYPTPGVPVLDVTHPDIRPNGIRDACIANIGGSYYLFVTSGGATPPTDDRVVVFQLTGFASVPDWSVY